MMDDEWEKATGDIINEKIFLCDKCNNVNDNGY